jgi:hypothetical protein
MISALTKPFGLTDVWLIVGFLAVVYLVVKAPAIWRALRFPGSSGWPLQAATVQKILVHPYPPVDDGSGGRESFVTEIAYSYEVNGEYYSGHYLCDLMSSQDEADRLAEAYPEGTTLLVRVHPSKPAVSVLDLHMSNPLANATRKEARAEERRLQKIEAKRRRRALGG